MRTLWLVLEVGRKLISIDEIEDREYDVGVDKDFRIGEFDSHGVRAFFVKNHSNGGVDIEEIFLDRALIFRNRLCDAVRGFEERCCSSIKLLTAHEAFHVRRELACVSTRRRIVRVVSIVRC